QAEDGIRDFHVTGVQTCTLPIYIGAEVGLVEAEPRLQAGRGATHDVDAPRVRGRSDGLERRAHHHVVEAVAIEIRDSQTPTEVRSEERRVGKECRARCATAQ